MKPKIYAKIHKNMVKRDRLYGTTTVGARGQVVIPAEARKELKIHPGDQLLVMGKYGKALGLVKTEDLADIIDLVMKNFAGSGAEKEIRDYAFKTFGKLINK